MVPGTGKISSLYNWQTAMDKLLRELITNWRSMGIRGESGLVVAVSGGADSCALLGALAELRDRGKIDNDLIAAHYNHALRGKESDEDEAFAKEFAGDFNIPFVSERMELEDSTANLEQVLRDARYEFLNRAALTTGSDFVLTGHTINDQAETFLLNLVRGAGVEGLSGMPLNRRLSPDSDVLLIRPFLRWAYRTDTEEFCHSRKIVFRRDPMNDDESFSRVRIRKSIIPALISLNPKIVDSLSRTARSLAEHRLVSEWLVAQNKEITSLAKAPGLSVKELKQLPPTVRGAVVRKWLSTQLGSLRTMGAAQFEAVERLATSKKSGKTVELPGNIRVVKNSGRLELSHSKVEK